MTDSLPCRLRPLVQRAGNLGYVRLFIKGAARRWIEPPPPRGPGVQIKGIRVKQDRRWLLYAVAMLIMLGIVGYIGLRLVDTTTRSASPTPAAPMATGALTSPEGLVPAAIHATVGREPLTVALAVTPVDVGAARFIVQVWRNGRVLRNGRLRFILSMPAQPVFPKTAVAATACHEGYCGQGQLRALGRWHLDVRVCPPGPPRNCVTFPFDFMNGANARFLFAEPPDPRFGSAAVIFSRVPQGASTLRIHLRPGIAVRAVATMPNMRDMGTAVYGARPQTHGWYGISLFFPMTGVTRMIFQARAPAGWLPIRTLWYDVDSAGDARLITPVESPAVSP